MRDGWQRSRQHRRQSKSFPFGAVALAGVVFLAGALVVACARGPDGAPVTQEVFEAAVRGIGSVEVMIEHLGPDNAASLTTFSAVGAEQAKVLGSKRLADLLGFGDIEPVADAGLPGTVLALDGAGSWLLGLDGPRFQELFAPSKDALANLAKNYGASAWKPVPRRAYPRWLDGFDNAAPGIWWGGGGMPVDIPSEFPWIRERGMTLCFSEPRETLYVAPGVVDTTLTDWFSALAARHDIPFRTNLWDRTGMRTLTWPWNREPLPYVRPAAGRLPSTGRFDEAGRSLFGIPYGSEPIPAVDPYLHDFRRRFMESLSRDPNFLGTKAVAEVPNTGIVWLANVAGMPSTKGYWQEYVRDVLGWDLPKLGLLHHGRRDFYKSWNQVEVPLPRDFLGLNEHSLDLAGAGWEGVADYDIEVGSFSVRGSPPSAKPVPETGWVAVSSNDPMLLTYRGGRGGRSVKFADYWLRRSFTLTPEQAAGLRYLHLARTPKVYNKYCDAWLNGRPLALQSKEERGTESLAFALDGVLRAGKNQIVLRMEGTPPIGYIALGPRPNGEYPHMSGPENRRWFDAVNFSAWLQMRGVEQTLQAMRTGDPNSQLKMMATHGKYDIFTPLCKRYGAYMHDTGGSGAWWGPQCGSRLAKSHGLPWSAEQGSQPLTAAGIRGAITRYVMYGADAVDMVFAVSNYKDNPEIPGWIDQNLNLIHTIGKMHLPTPPIGILRSDRVRRLFRGHDQPDNWDIGRGALQQVGRNFAYVEVPDIVDGIIDQFPVVIDCSTVLLDTAEVEGIRRYVERGGIFVAQHNTAQHLPEQADAWPLAASLGLQVTTKWRSESDFSKWANLEMRFAQDQDLMPSLRGKSIAGAGVGIDWLFNEYSGGVSYAPIAGQAANIRPVATWADDGRLAVAEVTLGRGRIILLGSVFFARMRDERGRWENDADRSRLLDEFLTSLGVARDSRVNGGDMWAEVWRSKNGVYDLYPVARMNRGDKAKPGVAVKSGRPLPAIEPSFTAEVSLRRAAPLDRVVEVSASGHPKVDVTWKDGMFTLPAADYELMQSRVFIAPREEIARSSLDWFKVQSKIWRALPPLLTEARPTAIPVPEDVIPAVEGWRLAEGTAANTAWTAVGFDDSKWKSVKLGTFTALGLSEESANRFRKTIDIPATWRDRRINLHFNANSNFWGVVPEGRLWIDGEPAPLAQPLGPKRNSNFVVDVTEQANDGKITLALEVDGTRFKDRVVPQYEHVYDRQTFKGKRRARPGGVTGIFFLESTVPAVATTELAGSWSAAKDVGVLTPVRKGGTATFTYLETCFTLPRSWPGKRVFLERPDRAPIGYIVLNGQVIHVAPPHRLDISGLVRRDGENVLRWMPDKAPAITDVKTKTIPPLNLVWTE